MTISGLRSYFYLENQCPWSGTSLFIHSTNTFLLTHPAAYFWTKYLRLDCEMVVVVNTPHQCHCARPGSWEVLHDCRFWLSPPGTQAPCWVLRNKSTRSPGSRQLITWQGRQDETAATARRGPRSDGTHTERVARGLGSPWTVRGSKK